MPSSKRISILIYSLSGGGAERVVSELIPYLEGQNMDVYLVLMNNTIDFHFPLKNPIHFIENSSPNESGLLKTIKLPILAWKYHLFLKKHKINTSVSFLTRPSYISIISRFFNPNRNIIISKRSNPSKQYGDDSFVSKFNLFLMKKLYIQSNLIIANSIGTKQDLVHHFQIPQEQICTIYNPINIEKIQEVESDNSIFDMNYFNMITVGRLDSGKNHSLLIETMKLLEREKIRLYIFGRGPLDNELKHQIMKLGLNEKVFLMGFDANPYKYMKAANLFVFSSNYEGFPNVILEALACNLPIISTNCPYGPNEIMNVEIKFNNNQNIITDYGILTPLNDKIRFVEAILFMIKNSDYRKKCILNSRERIKSFEKNSILEKYFQTIDSITD